MKIELFTEVNFRGPTAKNGKCIALVECETKKVNEKVDQNGEVLSGEYDVSEINQEET